MRMATKSPVRAPSSQKRPARRADRSSSSWYVTVSPEAAIVQAALPGWLAAMAPGCTPHPEREPVRGAIGPSGQEPAGAIGPSGPGTPGAGHHLARSLLGGLRDPRPRPGPGADRMGV